MTGALYRLGQLCVRHRLAVVLVWVAIAAGLVVGAGALGSQASDNVSLPGTGSQQVTDLLERGFPSQAYGSSPIVLKATSGQVTDSRYASAIDDSVTALQNDEFVAKVVSPLDRAGAGQVSRDGTVAYISVFPDRSLGDVTIDDAQEILDKADPAKSAGLEVSAGGPLGSKLSKPETETSEVVGLAMALIVLAFTFGSFVGSGSTTRCSSSRPIATRWRRGWIRASRSRERSRPPAERCCSPAARSSSPSARWRSRGSRSSRHSASRPA